MFFPCLISQQYPEEESKEVFFSGLLVLDLAAKPTFIAGKLLFAPFRTYQLQMFIKCNAVNNSDTSGME